MKKYVFLTSTILVFMSACGSSDKKEIQETSTTAETSAMTEDSGFQCDGRTTCKELDSYEEAEFFLKNCNIKAKIDSDNDGIPCEKKFNK